MSIKRLRLQYTLRSLLSFFVLFALVLVVLVIVVSEYRRAVATGMARTAIEEADGIAIWDYEYSASKGSIDEAIISRQDKKCGALSRLYDEYFHDIVYVDCGSACSHKTIEALVNLPKVRILVVNGDRSFDDKDLSVVGGLSHLEELYLNGVEKITDRGLTNLQNLRGLKTLNISSTPVTNRIAITDSGLENTGKFPLLRKLVLIGTKVTGENVPSLAGENLSELWMISNNTSDASLVFLQRFPNLTILHLEDAGISDVGLVHLAGLCHLTGLYLSDNKQISGSGFKHLRLMRDLLNLGLAETSVGDDGMALFDDMPNLTLLVLANTRITNASLVKIASFSELRTLNLAGCKGIHGTHGLSSLKKLTRLKNLVLPDENVDVMAWKEVELFIASQNSTGDSDRSQNKVNLNDTNDQKR